MDATGLSTVCSVLSLVSTGQSMGDTGASTGGRKPSRLLVKKCGREVMDDDTCCGKRSRKVAIGHLSPTSFPPFHFES